MKKLTALLLILVVVAASCTAQPPVQWAEFPHGPGAVAASPPTVAGPLRIDGQRLIDVEGRTVTLRGTNIVNKNEPFYTPVVAESTEQSWPAVFDGDDFDYLNDMGYNAVRLGVWYSQIVPSVGVIDTEYLDAVDQMVTGLEEQGFYVLLDFHQDIFHGMPTWATTDNAAAMSDEAPPFLSFIGWAAGYLSDRSIQQWRDLLNNVDTATTPGVGMWEALGQGAAAIAERFEGRPSMAGIELLNEPFPGIDYLRWIVDGCGDLERKLSEGYEIVTDLIREVAPTIVLWQGPLISAPHYGETHLAKPADAQTGFAWHMYCHGTDGGKLEPVDAFEEARCRTMVGTSHQRAAQRSRIWDAPAFMTEFGASDNPLDAILVTEEADKRFGSWLYWHYAYAGSPQIDSALARVYPQATDGTSTKLKFNPVNGSATHSSKPSKFFAVKYFNNRSRSACP